MEILETTRLKTPNHTRAAQGGDELIVSTPAGTKTLSGEHAEISRSLIAESDGETEFAEIVEHPSETNQAIAELLCEEGLLYPVEQLEALNPPELFLSLFETILLSLPPQRRETFAEGVCATNIDMRGNTRLAEHTLERIGDIGWNIGLGARETEPDILLFLETETTTRETREKVNQDWLAGDRILIRLGLDSQAMEIGPVLTPSTAACLDCLTTREEINEVTSRFDYTALNEGLPYDSDLLIHHGTRLLIQAATAQIPAGIGGRILTINPATLTFSKTRLLGVPGCESCE